MLKHTTTSLLLVAFALSSCSEQQSSEIQETSKTEEEKPTITLEKAPESPSFETASLMLAKPTTAESDSGFYTNFDFTVENYELGIMTPDAETRDIANSKNGQHIHFILDNDPYSAHYTPNFSKKMEPGNHVVLAFLSRSYHESVKNDNSFIVKKIAVGETEESDLDLSTPHLFYSRPKGTYSGKDTENLLLDFFLVNTTLSPGGNKVKAVINGKEFMIDEWAPYYIKGLKKGKVSIELTLLDAEGNLIESPFNPVSREVILK